MRKEGRREKRKMERREGRREGRKLLAKMVLEKEKKSLNKQQQLCFEINHKVPEGIAAGIKRHLFSVGEI